MYPPSLYIFMKTLDNVNFVSTKYILHSIELFVYATYEISHYIASWICKDVYSEDERIRWNGDTVMFDQDAWYLFVQNKFGIK